MFFLFQQELLKNFLLYGFYGFFLYIYIMQTEIICCRVTDKKAFFSVLKMYGTYHVFCNFSKKENKWKIEKIIRE